MRSLIAISQVSVVSTYYHSGTSFGEFYEPGKDW